MRRIAISLLASFIVLINLQAQKKSFSYDQLFKGAVTNVSKPVPNITGWADDEHYIEMRKDETDGKTKPFSVEVKSGIGKLYEKKENTPEA